MKTSNFQIIKSVCITLVIVLLSINNSNATKTRIIQESNPIIVIVAPTAPIGPSENIVLRVDLLNEELASNIQKVNWYLLAEVSPGEYHRTLIGESHDPNNGFEIEYSINETQLIEATPVINEIEEFPARTYLMLNGESFPMINTLFNSTNYCIGSQISLNIEEANNVGELIRVDWYELSIIDESHVDRTFLISTSTEQSYELSYQVSGDKVLEAIPVYSNFVGFPARANVTPEPWIGVAGGIAIGNRKIIDSKLLLDQPLENSGEITLINYSGTINNWEYSTDGQLSWQDFQSGSGITISYNNLQKTTSFRAKVYTTNCFQNSFVTSVPATIIIAPPLNSATSITYDNTLRRNSESKVYYDGTARELQRMSKDFVTNERVVSQSLYDEFGRNVGSTLTAPTGLGALSFQPNFITSNGENYNYKKFDLETNRNNPAQVDNNIPNSLGWYYSENNSYELNIPETRFPYSRIEYYNDASGEIKKATQSGEALKSGSGHESFSATFPVTNELDFYSQVRNHFWAEEIIGKNEIHASQTISIDPNGNATVQVSDFNGNLLMSAIYGNELNVSVNSYNVNPNKYHYFYLTSNTSFASNKIQYKVYNLLSNEVINNPTNLPSGFYKYICSESSIVQYSNGFSKISFYFYNQLNQHIATLSPEAVKNILTIGIASYSNISDVPFSTIYEYDLRGNIISENDWDKGLTENVYRADGEIRFSRNSKQQNMQDLPYSYVHYDEYGRVIENGEYHPGSTETPSTIYFDKLNMAEEVIEDVDYQFLNFLYKSTNFGFGVDVISFYYDQKDVRLPQLSGYIQNNISGKLSWSINHESNTWTRYSYDDEDRLAWIIESIPGLGEKTIDYSYDFYGNLSKVSYQKNQEENYNHFYFYDKNNRMVSTYAGNKPTYDLCDLQSKNYFFKNGMLKRTELGVSTQGIDFTYTAQGWLKGINNPAPGNFDPGQDSYSNSFRKDALSMRFEYYMNDYTRASANFKSMAPLTGSIYDKSYYNGIIKNIIWYSNKPHSVITLEGNSVLNPTSHLFSYNDNYELSSSSFGNPSFTNNNVTQTAIWSFRENNFSYDLNGNIKSLKRYDKNGVVSDDFVYDYNSNTSNKLASVTNYASYLYDEIGQLKQQTNVGDANSFFVEYNSFGKVKAIYQDSQHENLLVSYLYNERGQIVKYINTTKTLYYVAGLSGANHAIYEGNVPVLSEIPIYSSERIGVYYPVNGSTNYELNDHLGNVRVVIERNSGNVVQYNDYYASGHLARSGGDNEYRHKYQGQFAENESVTGWSTFSLRQYDTRIMRWISPDPYQQYHSPYLGMGNNPISRIDPDGGYDNICQNNSGGDDKVYQTAWLKNAPTITAYPIKKYRSYGFSAEFNKAATDFMLETAIMSLIPVDALISGVGKQVVKYAGKLAAKGGSNIKYLGRMEDLKGIPRSQTILDDLPNLGSTKANYYQNMSVIRRNLREGVIFKDASSFRLNSELAPTITWPTRTVGQTFYGAERNLMQNRGLWPK